MRRPVPASGAALVDAAGTVHEPAGPDARIVCLVPSITELLCDLGLASSLVGRTGFCIHPRATVAAIPKVGGTKAVDVERVRALAPTHVVLNLDENRIETAHELARFVPSLVVTDPRSPCDNIALYRLLGGIFGGAAEAEHLVTSLRGELRALAARSWPRRKVLYLIWRDPWMTVSRETYISNALSLVGWDTLPANARVRYPEIALEQFERQVERVLVSSEPYRFRERHFAEIAALMPGMRMLPIDGEMTGWYGSRAIRGLHYLGEVASSDTVDPGLGVGY